MATARSAQPKNTASRESTYQIVILSLKEDPAYLLLFSLGLLGGAMGVGATAVGFFRENSTLMVLGFSAWGLLLIACFLVIMLVEKRRVAERPLGGFHDQVAREAFLEGPSADFFAGKWQAAWYMGEGESRVPYAPVPQDELAAITQGSRIFCSAFDPSMQKTYWLDGRLSEHNVATFSYWSRKDKGVSSLSGVVLLVIDDSFDAAGQRAKGWWRGFTREGRIASGETEWKKLG